MSKEIYVKLTLTLLELNLHRIFCYFASRRETNELGSILQQSNVFSIRFLIAWTGEKSQIASHAYIYTRICITYIWARTRERRKRKSTIIPETSDIYPDRRIFRLKCRHDVEYKTVSFIFCTFNFASKMQHTDSRHYALYKWLIF